PVGPPARGEGGRAEDGGVDPRRVRLAGRGARGRPVRGAAGGAAPLPPNRDDGRLRPSPLPDRPEARLGGGVLTRELLGPRQPRRAIRGARRRLMQVVSSEALAGLHPTGFHPESPRRLEVLLEAFPERTGCAPASVEQVERCHTARHVARIRAIGANTWLDADTPASATSFEAALLAAGGAIEAVRSGGFA